jgi:hypothetical protein
MVASKMGTAAINPDDYKRPWYDRGALVIPGTNIRARTAGWNSLATLVPFAEAVGAMSTGQGGGYSVIAKELGAWSAPFIQSFANAYAGANTFGSDVFAPGPRGGSRVQNPLTGDFFISTPAIPFVEAVLQGAFPGQAGPIRRALAGGETVYDTASTVDLFMYRVFGKGDPDKLFYRRGDKVYKAVGPHGIVSSFFGYFGVALMREDLEALKKRDRRRQRRVRRDARREARGLTRFLVPAAVPGLSDEERKDHENGDKDEGFHVPMVARRGGMRQWLAAHRSVGSSTVSSRPPIRVPRLPARATSSSELVRGTASIRACWRLSPGRNPSTG